MQKDSDKLTPLEALPTDERPKYIATFTRGWSAFATGRGKLEFAALWLPAWVSFVILLVQGVRYIAAAIVLMMLMTAIALLAFVALKTGLISSNTGTFFKTTDRWRFWRDVLPLLIVYAVLCVAPHLGWNREPPV